MSRRRRTIEILAAAQLAPQELAMERERTRRQGATTQAALQALSMLPTAAATLGRTFADVEADKLAVAEKTKAAEAKRTADEEARNRQKALDALTEENTRSQIAAREAEQGRAGAAEGRAAAQAEAATKKSALEEAKAAREAAMDALRARARAGVALPTLIGAAAADDRLGDLDDDAVAGVLAEEQATAKQQDATTLKTLEQAKPKPVAPPRRAPGGAGGSPPKAKEPAPPKPSAQAEARKAKVTGLAADLTMLETTVKDLEQSSGPSPGPVLGRLRSAASGFIDDPKQTAYEAAAAAVNSQIFGLLRTDAPSESEAKVIQALQFYPTDRPERIRAKAATIRRILKARGVDEEAPLDVLAARAGVDGAAAAPAVDPAAAAEADALFAD